MGQAASLPGPRVGHWVALVGGSSLGGGGGVLTVGLVGLVGCAVCYRPVTWRFVGGPVGPYGLRGPCGRWGGVVWSPSGVSGCRWV